MIHYVNGSILYNMKLTKSNTSGYEYSVPNDEESKTSYNDGNTIAATFYTTLSDNGLTCSYFARHIKRR